MLQLDNVPLKTLALQFADSFTQKDAASIGELLHDDFCLYDPALKWVRGKPAVIAVLTKQFVEAKEVSYKVLNLFQERNTTILEFIIKIDAAVFYGVDFMDWRGGKMTEIRCYYNPPQK